MSESKTVVVYFDTECYKMGYIQGIENFKEALKKSIEEVDIISEVVEFKEGFKDALPYFLELIDTVQPTEK